MGRYQEGEIAASGVLADSRWPGRLCGAWRDDHGLIGTSGARTIDDSEAAGTRYLYLRGASRSHLPPYGLSDVLNGAPAARREIVVVEGSWTSTSSVPAGSRTSPHSAGRR